MRALRVIEGFVGPLETYDLADEAVAILWLLFEHLHELRLLRQAWTPTE